jgi:cytochrome b
MTKVTIWDVPTRLIHWMFAAGLLAAFLIAQVGGEHSSVFDYHAIIGLTLALVLALRLIWGVVGTRHARFSSYVFSPVELVRYMRSVVRPDKSLRYAGHNPATSWAAPMMFVLLAVVAATGVMTGQGSEAAEELHAASVYALLAVVGVHVIGVVVHSVRHRENLIMGMVDGRKVGETSDEIKFGRPIVALVLLVAVGGFAWSLVANYDPIQHHTHLPLIGTTLGIGEAEGADGATSDGGHEVGDND